MQWISVDANDRPRGGEIVLIWISDGGGEDGELEGVTHFCYIVPPQK